MDNRIELKMHLMKEEKKRVEKRGEKRKKKCRHCRKSFSLLMLQEEKQRTDVALPYFKRRSRKKKGVLSSKCGQSS